MQVARNFFLSPEKTLKRKLTEVVVAYRIESALSKDQILELYMNQIYLGQRTYGFTSAARTYFKKPLQELSLAEAAMLAGIPQNPGKHNPAVNPVRAKARQELVLEAHAALGKITQAQFDEAVGEPRSRSATACSSKPMPTMLPRWCARSSLRNIRAIPILRASTSTPRSTRPSRTQPTTRCGAMCWPTTSAMATAGRKVLSSCRTTRTSRKMPSTGSWPGIPNSDNLIAAVVTEVSTKRVRAEPASGDTLEIKGDGLRFAARALQPNAKDGYQNSGRFGDPRQPEDAKGRWSIAQMPEVDAAFVALNAEDGSYRAMVGGFDFSRNQFNHVTSAWRQPGSSIKPFVYSAALEKGFSPATLMNDAPLSLPGGKGGQPWEPRNDDGFDGPISLRQALARSKNVVAVRLLQAISPQYARDYLQRFGFDAAKHPANLTMVLGSGSVTPLQMAGAYAVFANGGFTVTPRLVQKITDARGNVLWEAPPPPARLEEQRAIDPRNAFIIDSMLREVARSGTGAQASQRLGRNDLAGKTGTTSDAVDGWFAGYSGNVVAVSWMGYDQPKSLGGREFGATLALPIWIDYMRQALSGKPPNERKPPPGVSYVDGDWLYDEFKGDDGVKTLDVEESPLKSIFDTIRKAFGG
jgi:penicillin-binding protein 1A